MLYCKQLNQIETRMEQNILKELFFGRNYYSIENLRYN